MKNPFKQHIDEEDRFGIAVTGGIHLVLLIIALLYHFSLDVEMGAIQAEVNLGEFRSGTVAQQAEVQPEQVATRPDPPEVQPEEPQPEIVEPVETPQPQVEPARPVDLPDQVEVTQQEEVIETPDTPEINPEVTEAVERTEEVVLAPPMARRSTEVQEGAEDSGVITGSEGEVNVDDGDESDDVSSAPYELVWEGDLTRTATIQPLPQNLQNEEATIQVQFEVHPDGRVGAIRPIQKMNPELEAEVLRTLRSWRFSRLPAGVPQVPQTGVVTFHFVFD